jgi:hypothetical protein
MEMDEDFMSQIPIWVVASLGKEVMLEREFAGACETYAKGCRGILTAIDTDYRNGYAPYAIVALDPEDETYLENFEFSDIRPISNTVKFSLNMEKGIIAF